MSSEHKDFTSTSTSTSTPAQPRTVAPTKSQGALDVTSLVTVAVLIAAGLILDLTVGKAISAIGIGPEFVIASFCLAIIVLKPRAVQSIIIGLIAGAVIQITTSLPGADLVAEPIAALVMFAFVSSAFAKSKVMPFVGSFVTTTVSGLIFAAIAIPAKHAGFDLFLVMVPVILGTALFNAIVVQALAAPLTQVTNHQ